ncbi:uncharacterized protein LOC113898552 [Bos indicus x Bos taurus]|uniref:uncharacterized protein LOC113898552 n=1 Tax=Bos indicus x Bos taurus TaxID=30522 RepID=UPI000F7D2DC5|nr:uncharacterized protein LOC113898552 [Bos indicus x Bos taurus]
MGGSKSSLGFLVLLLIVLFSGTSSDPRSQVFLSCECAMAKIKNMCLLGEEVKSMNARETQTDTLRDTGDLFKEQMPDVTPEKHIDKVASGPLPPQANTTCWQEDNGHISGQLCLINGCCRVYHPGGRQMKGKSENNRTVTFKVFKENCRLCYQAFLERCGEMLNTTAPPTTVPPTVPPTAPPISHVIWIAPGVLASFVIMGIVAWILYKKRRLCSQEAPDRCSVGLRTQSLLGFFCSPAVHFRAKRSDLRNPKSVYQLC